MKTLDSIPLVCFAVPQEVAGFRSYCRQGVLARILLTGMGADNATSAVEQALRSSRPSLILSCGFAGGLNPALSREALVCGTGTPEPWRAKMQALGVRPARFLTVTRIVSAASEKAHLWSETGADAVEMESAAIEQVARRHNVPFLLVRIVSDAWNEDLPLDFQEVLDARMQISVGRLAIRLFRQPSLVIPLIRLGRSSARCSRILGRTLATLVDAETCSK